MNDEWIPITDETPLPEGLPGAAREGWRLQTTRRDGSVLMHHFCSGILWDDVIAYRFIQVDMEPYVPPKRNRRTLWAFWHGDNDSGYYGSFTDEGEARKYAKSTGATVYEFPEKLPGDVHPEAAIAARDFGEDTLADDISYGGIPSTVNWRKRFMALVLILNGEDE